VILIDVIFDGALALGLPLLAWLVLATHDLRKAVVLFFGFGMLSAIAWVRLAAPDVALVEAALSAGVTGVLLLGAVAWGGAGGAQHPAPPASAVRRALFLLSWLAVVSLLGWAVLELPGAAVGVGAEALARAEETGVAHPVTAVLLGFRAYDTMLEILVLVAAALGVQALFPGRAPRRGGGAETQPLLTSLARVVFPAAVLVAGYLLYAGSHAPGGAFQAGSVLCGGALLLMMAGRIAPLKLSSASVRVAMAIGPALFLAAAALPVVAGRRMLELPPAWAEAIILTIESALTLSIAALLLLMFPGMPVAGAPEPVRERDGGR
jgi:multisubunit Na+/H+ antiporter MnhB subunit